MHPVQTPLLQATSVRQDHRKGMAHRAHVKLYPMTMHVTAFRDVLLSGK